MAVDNNYCASSADDGCCAGCVVVFLAVLFAIGVACCQESSRPDPAVAALEYLEPNGFKVRVLHIYPVYGGKHGTTLHGHNAVVEGVATKERREINVHPGLPVPGEIWTVTYEVYNYSSKLKFNGKVE